MYRLPIKLALLLVSVSTVGAVDYQAEIKPLLRKRCYSCHGALAQEAGLRLDTVDLMIRGGDSGPAIKPGDADSSLVLARVAESDVTTRMPPEHEGEPFDVQEIRMLSDWISGGATGFSDEQAEIAPDRHWAFQPIVRPPIPRVAPTNLDNPIDAFLHDQHRIHGLTPNPEAPRIQLLRRLYVDLIGLPPDWEQIKAWQQSSGAADYRRVVESLLNDPRHGQRWARHWMDIWRYSDWWGLGKQLRNSQKHIWHWRDWIVDSLNDDTPYDEMVRQMLAADELYPNELDKLRATGFLARNYNLFNRAQWMDETVEHVSKSLLGMTMNCARCHDHKYDPIEQIDYYRMRAFFEPYHVRMDMVPEQIDFDLDGVPRVFDGWLDAPTYRYIRGDENNPDQSRSILPGVPEQLAFADLEIEPIDLPIESWQPERRPWVLPAYLESAEANLTKTQAANTNDEVGKRRTELARAELTVVKARIAATRNAWNETDSLDAQDLWRAVVLAERRVAVTRAELELAEVEQSLAGSKPEAKADLEKQLNTKRETLKAAIKAEEEPEIPNHFTPLAGARWTPTRFQFSGKDDPTVSFPKTSTGRRTALANWITDPRNPLTARVAANHIWNRHFGEPLVSSVFDFGRNGDQSKNLTLLDWLAAELIDSGWSMKHMHRLIVNSAAYRRSSSSCGAGENVRIDPDNQFLWRRKPVRAESQVIRDSLLALAGQLDCRLGGPPVKPADQTASRRRSLYFFHSNNQRNQFLTTFDEALVTDCYRRQQSIVPQQALALAHSSLALDTAQAIANRINVTDDVSFIRQAFALVVGIHPGEPEIAAAKAALAQWRVPQKLARRNLIWALINHNDFVTVR